MGSIPGDRQAMGSRTTLLMLTIILLLGTVPSAADEPTGEIRGRVLGRAGEALPYASILIHGTSWGTMSLEDGTYLITGLPRPPTECCPKTSPPCRSMSSRRRST